MSDRIDRMIFQWVKEQGKDESLEPKDSKRAGFELFESAKQRHDLLAVRK